MPGLRVDRTDACCGQVLYYLPGTTGAEDAEKRAADRLDTHYMHQLFHRVRRLLEQGALVSVQLDLNDLLNALGA
jgi:hypothetical protein